MKIIYPYYFIFFFFIILCVIDKVSSKARSNNYQNKEKKDDNKNHVNSLNNLNNYDNYENEDILNIKNKKRKGKSKSIEDNLSEFINETKDNSEDSFNEEYNKLEKEFQYNLNENESKSNFEENNLNEEYDKMKPNMEDFHYNDNDEDMDEEDLTNIWNKNMQNFEPSTSLTFEIASNSEEYLFEEINMENTYFRGVFYSNNESDDNIIEFFISDPDGNVVYKKEASEGIFFFYTKKIGIYTITLKNSKWVGKKLTTVALGLGENPSLSSDHVKDFTNYIQEIVHRTKKLKNEIKYLSSKHMIHIEKMKRITNKAFIYCFIKLFVLIFLSLFTIYYIKNLVSNKRVL
ncbi:transmembrane emp24 domain-containing protein, putative [Plasmodium gallinaceum]|uniref:Transmembrane emp24 domain-containing protein, putative n=1 Tax=Plasmodium gallinaceum TaxID=5849 RepID=A0A1J1GQI6_PLAGA|nr:transmembrane emp24 domain-containing protein, putative [Plasmodium gallinaceum]CRG94524.1 transmembrane emp24 domain-containing protein, putative [Plasmodium gallinaceum]